MYRRYALKMKPYSKIEDLFKENKNKIYRLALGITKNEKDAEDILQATFIKIMKNLKNFKGDSNISTWIYKIAYNEALMYLRKKHREPKNWAYFDKKLERPPEFFIDRSRLPDKELLNKELKDRLEGAIKNMSIKYRIPLLLHNVEMLPVKDASMVLGININSFKSRLHRAHMIIRSEILSYQKDRELKRDNYIESRECGLFNRFVYEYVGNSLDREKHSSFTRHIEDCLPCKSFLTEYGQAIHISKALQCKDLPQDLQAKIASFLLKNK